MSIQPVSIRYVAPEGEDPRFYGWWGEMGFGTHLLKVLAAPRQGAVEVTWHAPLKVADFADRKALARAAEAAVRSGFEG
jgi:1-acyl-sn-glycerol-3-phosphate acyltransferase